MRPLSLVLAALGVYPLLAQTAGIRGSVMDVSGAVVPGASLTLKSSNGLVKNLVSSADGSYAFMGLAVGSYTVDASAPNLGLPQPVHVMVQSGIVHLSLQLQVLSTVQRITVEASAAPHVSADAAANSTAVAITGADLDALSDDPDDLANDLQALAGPSAGPNGGTIYVDGFINTPLPSKDAIREVRVNQNPFSPEYDKLGYGRIEVFTKPGSDKLHGSAFYNIGDAVWNTRDPYAAEKAPFLLQEYGGNLSGSVGKKASLFIDVRRDAVDNGAIINASILSPSLQVIDPYTQVFNVPQRRIFVAPRIDYQLNPKNTLSVKYGYYNMGIDGSGVGGFDLVSRGFYTSTRYQLLQGSETLVASPSIINETRFSYVRGQVVEIQDTLSPAILVQGSFNSGGSQTGHLVENQNNIGLQNYTSIAHKAHTWHFGLRLREWLDASVSPQNFDGTYTFSGGLAPALDSSGDMIQISPLESYRRTLLFGQLGYSPAQIRALGGEPSQFTINAGNPALSANYMDAGLFVGDDWRVTPNLTLSLGLRYEFQTNVSDSRDIAPRVGLAWAPRALSGANSAQPKLVIRAGFGMFYDRFPLDDKLMALRFDKQLIQQYVVTNPDFFPNAPPVSSLGGTQSGQAIQEVDKNLRAPYILQSALSVERQLPKNTTVAVTYANSHGLHELRSQYLPPSGTQGTVYLMESSGLYNQNQFIVNVNSRLNGNISLFGNYMFNHALSNTDGVGTFPANPNSSAGEYGPASTDIHHRMTFGGSINTRWNVRLNPFIVVQSGAPFDITTGQDFYGDTLFNARPGIATDPDKPGVIRTAYGLLDPNPTPGEAILPRNYGRGPGLVQVNARLSKTFSFGPAREGATAPAAGPPGGGRTQENGIFRGGLGSVFAASPITRRYTLSLSIQGVNLLNHTNPGPIVGNISSPLFGQANQSAGAASGGTSFNENANNRRLELQIRLSF